MADDARGAGETVQGEDRLVTGEMITGRTKVLGLIADPVVQARSPAMVNQILAERGLLGPFVLVPMQTPANALRQVIAALRHVGNFAGAIISMPHKTGVVPLVDELTPDARLVGAVNVISRNAAGRLRGTMLDGEGFVAGLRSAGHAIDGASCLLVGAGGAAAAIAFALAKHGCRSLTIQNRTASKAASLASRVRRAFPDVHVQPGEPRRASYDLVINGTSLGMQPDDELPVPEDIVEVSGVVADCVVAPEMTQLLQVAQRSGRRVHTGVPMLVAQMDLMLRFLGVE